MSTDAILATLRRRGIRCAAGPTVHGCTVDAYHVRTAPLDAAAADKQARALGVACRRRVAIEPWDEGIRVMVSASTRVYPRLTKLWAACPPAGPRIPIGVGWDNQPLILDLAQHPHVGVIGITGSGKSWLLSTLVAGLAVGSGPDRLRIVLCDPKGDTWRAPLDRLLHSDRAPATPSAVANGALAGVVATLDERMRDGFDRSTMPRIVVVVDEASAVDHELLTRIVDYGRGLGIHLIAASRKLGTKALPHSVWSQLGARLCGRTATGDHYTDTMALERPGLASRLLGDGDFYAALGGQEPVRFQVAAEPPESAFWSARGWASISHAGALPKAPGWERPHGGHVRGDDERVIARIEAGELRPTVRSLRQAGIGQPRAERIIASVPARYSVSDAPAAAATQ